MGLIISSVPTGDSTVPPKPCALSAGSRVPERKVPTHNTEPYKDSWCVGHKKLEK